LARIEILSRSKLCRLDSNGIPVPHGNLSANSQLIEFRLCEEQTALIRVRNPWKNRCE